MEAFSKRTRPASIEARDVKSLAVVTPARFQTLFDRRLNDICARFDEWSIPLTVIGRLGEVPPDTWRRHESLPLIDQQGGIEIRLEVPLPVLDESGLRPGDLVRATGFMRARLVRDHLVARLEVLTLCAHEHGMRLNSPSAHTVQSLLRDLPSGRHAFPYRGDATLLVIGIGVSAQSLEGLCRHFGGFWRPEAVHRLALPIDDAARLARHIHHAEEDIVLLVAAEGSITTLEDVTVLKTLAFSQACRLLAFQHDSDETELRIEEQRGTIAQHIVDHAFASPLEAGRYIRQESAQYWERREEERAREEELSALRTSLARLTDLPEKSARQGTTKAVMTGMVIGALLLVGFDAVAFIAWRSGVL
ncbi:hypothetical protein [Saccharibacter floricola]|uniref:hypothetical protein n=1 Tax=Saccharibacter floricola TaxID=231053 RepID=UPI0003797FF7|nr:hypothetical protein [Saccharibacter floricola]